MNKDYPVTELKRLVIPLLDFTVITVLTVDINVEVMQISSIITWGGLWCLVTVLGHC